MVPPWVPHPAAPPAPPPDGDGAIPRMVQPGRSTSPAQQNQPPRQTAPPVAAALRLSPIAPRHAFRRSTAEPWKLRAQRRLARTCDARSDITSGAGTAARGTAVRRFGGTASTAGALYGALSSSVAAGQARFYGQPSRPCFAGRAIGEGDHGRGRRGSATGRRNAGC